MIETRMEKIQFYDFLVKVVINLTRRQKRIFRR